MDTQNGHQKLEGNIIPKPWPYPHLVQVAEVPLKSLFVLVDDI